MTQSVGSLQLPQQRERKSETPAQGSSVGRGGNTVSQERRRAQFRRQVARKKWGKERKRAQRELERAVSLDNEGSANELSEPLKKRKRRNKRPKHDRSNGRGGHKYEPYNSFLYDGSTDVYDLPYSPGFENRDANMDLTDNIPLDVDESTQLPLTSEKERRKSRDRSTPLHATLTKRKRALDPAVGPAPQSSGDKAELLNDERKSIKKIRLASENDGSLAIKSARAHVSRDAQYNPHSAASYPRAHEPEYLLLEAESSATNGSCTSPTPPPRCLSPELGDVSLISPAIVAAARPRPCVREQSPEVAESIYGGEDWTTSREGTCPSPPHVFQSSFDGLVSIQSEFHEDRRYSDESTLDVGIQHAVDTQILSDMVGFQENGLDAKEIGQLFDHGSAFEAIGGAKSGDDAFPFQLSSTAQMNGLANAMKDPQADDECPEKQSTDVYVGVAHSSAPEEDIHPVQQGFHHPMICQIL
jgi:hypothetical protein